MWGRLRERKWSIGSMCYVVSIEREKVVNRVDGLCGVVMVDVGSMWGRFCPRELPNRPEEQSFHTQYTNVSYNVVIL
jgi:hypothetical protein